MLVVWEKGVDWLYVWGRRRTSCHRFGGREVGCAAMGGKAGRKVSQVAGTFVGSRAELAACCAGVGAARAY